MALGWFTYAEAHCSLGIDSAICSDVFANHLPVRRFPKKKVCHGCDNIPEGYSASETIDERQEGECAVQGAAQTWEDAGLREPR